MRFQLTPVIPAGHILSTFTTGQITRAADAPAGEGHIEISGRYPHLAMFNTQGECGTGAVAPWADRLWVITYGPHLPDGSDDKLYEIDAGLNRVTRPESVGGTPADRMIHRESNQLNIGPYFIDEQRNVRVVTPKVMPGRLTASARDLADPANKVYIFDMEGTLYEVDVHTLEANKLFARAMPGAHGKGGYSGQGRLVLANNGSDVVNKAKPAAADPLYAKDPEAWGCLAEWDGKNWDILERRQFTDITGPGGIDGPPDENAPLWAIGWDKRSVILKLLDGGQWHTFRLPVGRLLLRRQARLVHRVAAHPRGRRRQIAHEHARPVVRLPKDLLRRQHRRHPSHRRLPENHRRFLPLESNGHDQIVFGMRRRARSCRTRCLASRSRTCGSARGKAWPSAAGPRASAGRGWTTRSRLARLPSPYLLAGYSQRVLHLSHDSDEPITFTIETDADGHGKWAKYQTVTVAPHGYAWHVIPADLSAEWVRLNADHDCAKATAYFHYGPGGGAFNDPQTFASLPDAAAKVTASFGTLRPLGGDRGTLLFNVFPSGDVR